MKEGYNDLIGAHVKLRYNHGQEEEGMEYGVIVNAWHSEEINATDCYVALYEEPIEIGSPATRPQIYRYALSSLEIM